MLIAKLAKPLPPPSPNVIKLRLRLAFTPHPKSFSKGEGLELLPILQLGRS